MSLSNRLRFASLVGIAVVVMSPGWLRAQSGASFPQFFIPVVFDPAASPLPNPTPTIIKEWGPLPDGRRWGSTAGVDIGPDGHVWAYDRCGDPGRPVPGGVLASPVGGCENSNVDPILKFDRHTGEVLTSLWCGAICDAPRHPRRQRRQRLGDRHGGKRGGHEGSPGDQVQPGG